MRWSLAALLFLCVSLRPQVQPRLPVHVESLDYPPLARAARIEGDVVVEVWLNAEGRVQIVDGGRLDANGLLTNPMLTQEAFDNVRKWRFQPGPESKLKITYRFKLAEAPAPGADRTSTKVEFDFPDSVTVSAPPPERDH